VKIISISFVLTHITVRLKKGGGVTVLELNPQPCVDQGELPFTLVEDVGPTPCDTDQGELPLPCTRPGDLQPILKSVDFQ
jgi:hypothetical protein